MRVGRSILATMANPFVHLDLATDDMAGAKKFYKSVFDWKFKDVPQMKWSGIDVGKGVGGGIGEKQMPNQPTAWTAYVDVADVKKTIAKAKKAGATVIVPFMDMGSGHLGVFVDPQGATIGVWTSVKKPAAKKASAKKAGAKKAAKRK
jgi:predicted enzyme related to lactoylglutathione lyase